MLHCYKKLLLLIGCLACWQQLLGQEHVLKGNVQMYGENPQNYAISFMQDGENLKGRSITNGGGSALTANIIGRMTAKELYIHETSTVSNFGFFKRDICFFISTLHPTTINGKKAWFGTFDAYTDYNRPCGTGTISLQEDLPDVTVKAPVEKRPKEVIASVPVAVKPLPVAVVKPKKTEIDTAVLKPIYEWNNDTLGLDIWDGFTIDGDVVSVEFNGQTILPKKQLDGNKIHFDLPLNGSALNTLFIHLYEEGWEPPNTPNITLYDGALSKRTIIISGKYGETAKLYFILKKK